MDQFDDLILSKISEKTGRDIINVMCVSKAWEEKFHKHYLHIKPDQSVEDIYKVAMKKLKLGYHYDKLMVLSNIVLIFDLLDTKRQKKLKTALELKLCIDKPCINYVPLIQQDIEQTYLQQLKIMNSYCLCCI